MGAFLAGLVLGVFALAVAWWSSSTPNRRHLSPCPSTNPRSATRLEGSSYREPIAARGSSANYPTGLVRHRSVNRKGDERMEGSTPTSLTVLDETALYALSLPVSMS